MHIQRSEAARAHQYVAECCASPMVAGVGLALLLLGVAAIQLRQSGAKWPRGVPELLTGFGAATFLGSVSCCIRDYRRSAAVEAPRGVGAAVEVPSRQEIVMPAPISEAKIAAILQSDAERREQLGRRIIEYAQLIQRMRERPDGEHSRQPQSTRADQRPEELAQWDHMVQTAAAIKNDLDRCSIDTSQEGMTWQGALHFLEECLWKAIEHENEQCARALIEAGVDVNCLSSRFTPLVKAVMGGRNRLIQPLIDARANVNGAGPDANVPLVKAVDQRDEAAFQILLQAHPDVNAMDYSGRTALMVAAVRGNVARVQTLLDRGALVNTIGQRGTALHAVVAIAAPWAEVLVARGTQSGMARSRPEHDEIVRLLLDRRADPTLLDRKGRSAGDLSRLYGRREAERLLTQCQS